MVKPALPSPPRCCAGSTSSSPAACTGMPPSPAPPNCPQPPKEELAEMNRGWGQAPRAPEAPPRDLAKHHEQAPPRPHQTRLHAVGNQTRLTNYVETRTGQPPNLDKIHLRRCLHNDTPCRPSFC